MNTSWLRALFAVIFASFIVAGVQVEKSETFDLAASSVYPLSQKISVGILLTGRTMTDEIRKVYGSYAQRVRNWISEGMDVKDGPYAILNIENEVVPIKLEFEFYEYFTVNGEMPESVESHDWYLVTGSNHGVNENAPWMHVVEQFIRDLDYMAMNGTNTKPVAPKLMGICFGHQLIHKALGGTVVSDIHGHSVSGTPIYDIYQKMPFMLPSDPFSPKLDTNKLVLDALHADQVTKPADGFTVFAGNDVCPVGATTKGSHILTFQPHPEYPNKENRYVLTLIDYALGAGWINDDQHEEYKMQALNGPFPESHRVMAWTAQFIVDGRRPFYHGDEEIKVTMKSKSNYINEITDVGLMLRAYVSSYSKRLVSTLSEFADSIGA